MEQQPKRLGPLESAELVSSQSKDVTILLDGVQSLADKLEKLISSQSYSLKSWKQHTLHPQAMDRTTVDWIFFIDLMNFSFWSDDPCVDYSVEYGGEDHIDYWALCSVVRRAIDEGIPLLSAEYLAKMSIDDVRHVFRSSSSAELSQLETRQQHLNTAGKVLMEKFNGSFSYCVESCGHSARLLRELIVANFPSFRDEADFNGTPCAFYKRAQILIADLWACFENKSFGRFEDIDCITMFADYRVPQVLLHHGVLQYSESLMSHLRERRLVDVGHRWELEIRAATIWSVELVRRELVKRRDSRQAQQRSGTDELCSFPLNSIMIDFHLWYSSKDMNLTDQSLDFPMHRTRTTFY
eukprot:scpid87812/ scgid24067/ UPF0553 protein v1g230591